MNLKNFLKNTQAQSTVEYLVLFAVIATLTLLSVTEFFPRLRESAETCFHKAVAAMD